MNMYLDRIGYTINARGKGDVSFFWPDDVSTTWTCFPTYGMSGEEFLNELEKPLRKRGYITPYDAQEVACKEGLATYSKR